MKALDNLGFPQPEQTELCLESDSDDFPTGNRSIPIRAEEHFRNIVAVEWTIGVGWTFQELYSQVFWIGISGHQLQPFSQTDASHLPPMARARGQHVFFYVMTVREFASARGCGPRCMRELLALIGRSFDQRKAKDMAPHQDYCDLEHKPSRTFTAGCVRLKPRERLLTRIFPAMEHALARPPTASALLGNGWNYGVLVCGYFWEGG